MKNYILIGLAFVAMIGISVWLVSGTGSEDTQQTTQPTQQEAVVSGNEGNTPPPPLEQTNYITDKNSTENENSFVLDDNAIKQAQLEEEAKQKRLKEEQEINAKLQELKEKTIIFEEQTKSKQEQKPVIVAKSENKEADTLKLNNIKDFAEEQKFVSFLNEIKSGITLYPDRTFKYKNKIYQAKDKFLDKYIVESVSNIAIRFKDQNFAYSLRFIEE